MNTIKIKKGHDIRIAGAPAKTLVNAPAPKTIGVRPIEFKYLKPKLMVKEGDSVKIGSPLFFDKKNPDVRWASPAAGVIKSIIYGERRSVLQIVIERSDSEETVKYESFEQGQIGSLGREKLIEQILNANLWPLIRQRPFSKVADPKSTPKSIFISGFNSAPLTVDLEIALEGREKEFQAGLDILSQLTDGKVFLNISDATTSKILTNAEKVEITKFSGPHPSGNVGIQIHHLDPINPDEIVWTVNAQHVATLGDLFLTGKFNPEIIVTVGGPAVTDPCHLKSRIGSSIEVLVKDRVAEGKNRVVGGDPLSGRSTGHSDHIGYYTTTVSVLPVSEDRPFLGWLAPGSSNRIYSLLRAYFLQSFTKPFKFNTNLNGSQRHMVPVNAWESVLPMDILPNPLYRSIMAEDIEEMEKLGILECDEEDFALCTFGCPSKINLGGAIRKGLDLVEKEG